MRRSSLLLGSALLALAAGCDGSIPIPSPDRCGGTSAAPTALALAGASTGIAVVSWTAPAAVPRCTLSGYRVRLDGAQVAFAAGAVQALTGLAPGSAHTVTVAAVNERGASRESAPLAFTTPAAPDLGPNAHVFDPSMSMADIQQQVDAVYALQQSDVTAQFDAERHAILFKPGAYAVDVGLGYYTAVAGLGALPGDVTVTGRVHSDGHFGGWSTSGMNATQNFWRSVENFTVVPTPNVGQVPTDPGVTVPDDGGTYMRWAVSQACPFRRMHVKGDVQLHHWGGWASGGWISDSVIDGEVNSGSQQQWFSRNASWASWSNVNWNHVFMGVDHPFPGSWPDVHTTILPTTPVVREKPFLHVDAQGAYAVFLPALRQDVTGPSWAEGVQAAGSDLSIQDFYVARPADAVATLNAVLAAGKHLLLTPGIYRLDDTLRVTRPGTVVLGLGFATLHPDTGLPAMTVADVDGVVLAGLLFDAGALSSPTLLEVGTPGASADHSANPTSLHDLFFRVGGAEAGQADVGLALRSHDVIGDHFWIWRADHGQGVGWTENPSANGLVVEGDDVTIYGLFVEHFEKEQTLWTGERGRTYFYQSEDPYDVPDQASWMDGAKNGYASYVVADGVQAHEAWGLGVYSVFNVFPALQDSAIEVPVAPGVLIHHAITFGLSQGTIAGVVNGEGGPATSNPWQQGVVVEYPTP